MDWNCSVGCRGLGHGGVGFALCVGVHGLQSTAPQQLLQLGHRHRSNDNKHKLKADALRYQQKHHH